MRKQNWKSSMIIVAGLILLNDLDLLISLFKLPKNTIIFFCQYVDIFDIHYPSLGIVMWMSMRNSSLHLVT